MLSVAKTNKLMSFMKIIAVYCNNQTKKYTILYGKHAAELIL